MDGWIRAADMTGGITVGFRKKRHKVVWDSIGILNKTVWDSIGNAEINSRDSIWITENIFGITA